MYYRELVEQNLPVPKRGMTFLHSRIRDPGDFSKPAKCKITRIARDAIYYSVANQAGEFGKADEYTTFERWPFIVKTILTEKNYTLNVIASDRAPFDLQVWENPTQRQLEALLHKYFELRGVTDQGEYWVWNASESIHWDVRKTLGIPTRDFLHNFFISMRGKPPNEDISYSGNLRYDSDQMTLWFNDYQLPPRLARIFPNQIPNGTVSAF